MNHTEGIGGYGITPIGFFRAKVGTCDKCAAPGVTLCRVWSGVGGYRVYLVGEYCAACARALATQKHEQDEAAHRERVLREWNT